MERREIIINNYIDAYNHFDIDKMIAGFDDSIVFENISNGVKNMILTGLASFKEQAKQSKKPFSKRKQSVKSFKHTDNESEVEIDYYAILEIDLPNGLKKGDEITLQGKSIIKFSGDKIIALTDIS